MSTVIDHYARPRSLTRVLSAEENSDRLPSSRPRQPPLTCNPEGRQRHPPSGFIKHVSGKRMRSWAIRAGAARLRHARQAICSQAGPGPTIQTSRSPLARELGETVRTIPGDGPALRVSRGVSNRLIRYPRTPSGPWLARWSAKLEAPARVLTHASR